MDEEKEQVMIGEGQIIIHWQKFLLSILSVLVSISIVLSGYIFTTMERRLTIVEQIVTDRGERIAVLEQQARENNAAHARIEAKVDALLSIAMNGKLK
jgi:hypothetical protein